MSPAAPRRRRTWTSPAALLALACFLAVAAASVWIGLGRPGADDAPGAAGASRSPSPGPSRSASPVPGPVPERLRVLRGPLRPDDPADVVWVQADTLHVGTDDVDLAGHAVDAFVLTRGAVYFLDSGRMWTTDTFRVRDTGVGGAGRPATDLVTDRGGRHVRVTVGGRRYAWDVTTGRSVAPREVVPVTSRDLLGAPVTVRVRGDRSDVPAGPARPGRAGPGRWTVLDSATAPLAAVLSDTGQEVPLTGVVGDGFELARWTGASTFHGLALRGGRPAAVLACDLRAEACETVGTVAGGESLLLGGPTGS